MRRGSWRALPAAVLLAAGPALAVASPAAAAPVATNDPGRSRQWALDVIGAPEAWAVATGEGITIAVVDSGLDVTHPDLRDKIDATTDCVGHDDEPGGCLDGAGRDDAGHGTHVAGIAAASTDNGEGVAGVAPMARILGVRVLANECPPGTETGCEAEGTESDVAEGVRWAADHGADVINLSLGSVAQAVVGPGERFAEALEYAWQRGAIPVLVAGNDLLLPGSLVEVPAVVVSATDRDDRRASYSNGVGNARWAVAAPGGESDSAASCEAPTPNGILSTYYRPGSGGSRGVSTYACIAGTSMAAPHVAGALAVLRSAGFTPQEAVDRLLATARDLGPAGPDGTYGSGRIDLAAALAGVAPTGQPLRPGGTSPPTTGGGGGGGPTTAGPGPSTTGGSGATATTGTPGASTTTAGGSPATEPPPTGPELPGLGEAGDPDDERASGTVDVGSRPGGGDDIPPAALATAVLAVAAVGAGHLWRFLAASNLARRTPGPN